MANDDRPEHHDTRCKLLRSPVTFHRSLHRSSRSPTVSAISFIEPAGSAFVGLSRLASHALLLLPSSNAARDLDWPLPSGQRRRRHSRPDNQDKRQHDMQDEKCPGNPPLDIGHGAIRPSLPLFGQAPLAHVRHRRQVLFEFVDQLELHAVQIPVRPDNPMPEQTDDDAQKRNRNHPPTLTETAG